jgi:hypothetical protein
LLGGKDNSAADREAVRQVLRAAPEVRDTARANRAFLQWAVRFLAGEAGIRQFIDIGTGIPAPGTSERGRGLRVVQGLSVRTGYLGDQHGRTVWAQIAWTAGPAPTIRAGR